MAFDKGLQEKCIDYVFNRTFERTTLVQMVGEEEEKDIEFYFDIENDQQKILEFKRSVMIPN